MKEISELEWVTMTYEECKKLDEMYGTLEYSPLHRSRRFPELWKKECEKALDTRAFC